MNARPATARASALRRCVWVRIACVWLASGLCWPAGPAGAGDVCDPAAAGSVSLIILKTPEKVIELAKSVAKGVPVVARDATTIVFRDGRVITSDVEAVSRHLNRLGWGERRINVVAAFAVGRKAPARRRG